jgi:hypothetical protein
LKGINVVNLDDLEQSAAALEKRGELMTISPLDVLDLVLRLRTAEAAVRIVARSAVAAAEQVGQQMTVERKPCLPLAMGNHVPVVTFRAARDRA